MFFTNNFPANCRINRFISNPSNATDTAEGASPLRRGPPALSRNLAPFLIKSWHPLLRGGSIRPGAANTCRPLSAAILAVINAPLVRVARLNPAQDREFAHSYRCSGTPLGCQACPQFKSRGNSSERRWRRQGHH